MREDQIDILNIIKSAGKKVNQKIKKLKIKLGLVKDHKKDLARVELKLRSMRAIATKIRDEDLNDEEHQQLQKRFDELKDELNY